MLDPGVTARVLERLRKARVEEKDPKLQRLFPQEERILDMIADGSTNRQMAENLKLSEKTEELRPEHPPEAEKTEELRPEHPPEA